MSSPSISARGTTGMRFARAAAPGCGGVRACGRWGRVEGVGGWGRRMGEAGAGGGLGFLEQPRRVGEELTGPFARARGGEIALLDGPRGPASNHHFGILGLV